MRIAIHIQPSGSFLAIPKNYGTENAHLWGRPPKLVFDAATNNDDIESAILALIKKDWVTEGSLANVVVGILTSVFTEGVRYGMQKSREEDVLQRP